MNEWTDGRTGHLYKLLWLLMTKLRPQEEKRFAPDYTATGDSSPSLSPHPHACSLPLTPAPALSPSPRILLRELHTHPPPILLSQAHISFGVIIKITYSPAVFFSWI